MKTAGFYVPTFASLVLLGAQRADAAVELTVTVHGKRSVNFAGQDAAFLSDLADFLEGNSLGFPSTFIEDLRDPDIVPDAIDLSIFDKLIDIEGSGVWGHNAALISGPEGRAVRSNREYRHRADSVDCVRPALKAVGTDRGHLPGQRDQTGEVHAAESPLPQGRRKPGGRGA